MQTIALNSLNYILIFDTSFLGYIQSQSEHLYNPPVPLRVLFLFVYNLIIWPMVLTLSLNMMPWACTMKKYVLADGKSRHIEFSVIDLVNYINSKKLHIQTFKYYYHLVNLCFHFSWYPFLLSPTSYLQSILPPLQTLIITTDHNVLCKHHSLWQG